MKHRLKGVCFLENLGMARLDLCICMATFRGFSFRKAFVQERLVDSRQGFLTFFRYVLTKQQKCREQRDNY